MKSDNDDPNNHAPEVSPGDDWDDLEAVSEKARLGLPPRRSERGLPPKKEARGSIVNRHEPKSLATDAVEKSENTKPGKKDGDDDQPELKLGAPAKKRAKKAAKKTAKKAARKSARKAAKKADGKKAAKVSAPAPGLSEIVEDADKPEEEDGVRLPPASSKPNRLSHRIGTGETADTDPRPATRPIQKIAAAPKIEQSGASDEDVARMRRRFVRGERQDWGEEMGRDSGKWMVYTGVGVVALVIITVALSQMGGNKKPRDSDKALYGQLAPAGEKEVEETDDLAMLELLTSSQQEAKEIYGKFATAASPSVLEEFIINGEKVFPLVRENWKPPVSKADWIPGDEAVWTVLDRNGQRYGVLAGSHPDFTDFSAFFNKDGEELKLDWKATTGYGTATFEEMKTGAGDASEIRAWVSLADFYTFALPEGEYRSFRLMSPDGNATLWAYTERDGELDLKLMRLFIPSQITGEAQSEVQVTVVMEPGPEDGLKNQWLIRELTSLSWLDEIEK